MNIRSVCANAFFRLVGFPDKPRAVTRRFAGPGSVMIDVGANVGEHTYAAKGEVWACEPCGETFAELVKKRTSERQHLFRTALSNAEGERMLYRNPRNAGNNSFVEHANRVAGEMVPCTTLDIFARTHGIRPTYIKIDVEGHEMEVLQGALATISACKPVLLIECDLDRALALLAPLGYTGEPVDRINQLYICRHA